MFCLFPLISLLVRKESSIKKLFVSVYRMGPATQKEKINLKDKVEDGAVDLSLCDIQDVPVREIVSIPL